MSNRRIVPTFAQYAPLKILIAYLSLTLLIAVAGPIEYYRFPIGKTVLFVTSVMALMVFGYSYGVVSKQPLASKRNIGNESFVRNFFDLSLALAFISLLISILEAAISGQLNTDFSSIGDTYSNSYAGYERNTGNYSVSFILYSLSLPFSFISFILGFYFFFQLSVARRILVVALTISSLLFYVVGSGKQKQLGDILIFLIAVAAIKYGVRRRPIQLKWIVGSVAFGLAGLMAFAALLGQRYAALGVDAGNINNRVMDRLFFDTSHPIFLIFGQEYGLNISMFLSYLSQGYYGLGLALETDWNWTHFMGFSYSISVLSNRLLGLDWEWPNTLLYQVGLTTGWGESKWHTVFTHFATDFTFPGTALLFGLFAYVYARAWISAVRFENPFSILMFALLTQGAFFIPANNQLLHTPGALFTTILVSGLYIGMSRRFNIPDAERLNRPIWRRTSAARRP